jgi:hypothetical protein
MLHELRQQETADRIDCFLQHSLQLSSSVVITIAMITGDIIVPETTATMIGTAIMIVAITIAIVTMTVIGAATDTIAGVITAIETIATAGVALIPSIP